MTRYIVGRLAQALLALLALSLFIFLISRVAGDPVLLMAPPEAKAADLEALRVALGFDRPLPEQYATFVFRAIQGDFGRSLKWGVPAAEVVLGRVPATFALALGAMILTLVLGLPIGIASALKPGSLLDSFGKLISLLGQSLPPFWIGIMLIMTVAVWWRLLPAAGRGGPEYYVLPSISLGWYLVAAVARVTRSSMLEVLGADFVRTARSKGLGEGSVIWKHAFRNAAIPVLTLTSLQLANLLGGAVTVEIIFAWPGIGRIAVEAILSRDYAVVQAVVLLTAAIFLAISLIVDILYAYLDPRITYS